MENLQRYENNIKILRETIENKQKDYEELKVTVSDDNIRLESLRKMPDDSIKNEVMINTINKSNELLDKAIEENNKKIEKAKSEIEKLETKIIENKNNLKEAIYQNRKEAKDNKAKAFNKYAMMNKKFNLNIEKGRNIKLKMKAFSADHNNKEVYKTVTKEHTEHLKDMKEIAKKRNQLWELYNEASKENEKVLIDTEGLLHKYNLEEIKNEDILDKKDNSSDIKIETLDQEEKEENAEEIIDQNVEPKTPTFNQDSIDSNKMTEGYGVGQRRTQHKEIINEDTQNMDNSKSNKIQKIYISEKDRTIRVYDDSDNVEELWTISGILDKSEKRKLYKDSGVKEICKKIMKGKNRREIKRLRKKINPNIVNAICSKNEFSDTLEKYINCIKNEEEFPFEVVHDLGKLNIISKIFRQKSKYMKAEEKCGAKILNKLFNKNQTLETGNAEEMIEEVETAETAETAGNNDGRTKKDIFRDWLSQDKYMPNNQYYLKKTEIEYTPKHTDDHINGDEVQEQDDIEK